MTTSRAENQPEQGELFEGYRPLITHNRKRNTVPGQAMPRVPPSTRKGALARRGKAARFEAKVDALIECLRPVEARPKERNQKWKE